MSKTPAIMKQCETRIKVAGLNLKGGNWYMRQTMSMSEPNPPIMCDLNALRPEERERRHIVLSAVAQMTIGRGELANGFELNLDARRVDLAALGEWISLERRCCP